MTITLRDKVECLKRELSYRRRVYPRWVQDHRLAQGFADRQIAVMEAILQDYQQQHEAEEASRRLL